MTARLGSAAPRGLVLLVAAVVLAGLPLAVIGGFGLLVYPPYAGIGALLAIRKPRNPIGWLLIGLGWVFIDAFAPLKGATAAFQAGTASTLDVLVAWLSAWIPTTGFVMLLVIMIVFPTGHLPTGRWRGPSIVAIAAAAFAVVLAALVPTIRLTAAGETGPIVAVANPVTFLPDAPPWDWLTEVFPYPVFIGVLVAGAGSMLVRARRATGQEQQQLRWIVAAFAALTSMLPLGFAILIVFGDTAADVAWLPALVSYTLPPIAIGIAILRYRLYDLDRIVSRTIAYALVSAIVAVVFGGVIVLMSAALGSFVQGQTVAVAGSTLIAAALFQPVRRRVQTAVDHRFNRARYDAERTATDFAELLRDEVDLASVSGDIVGVVDTAFHPSTVSLWIRRSGTTTP